MTQQEIEDRVAALGRCLDVMGEMTPELRRKLDAAKTSPDKLNEAMDAVYGRFAIFMSRIAKDFEDLHRCLAVYVTAAARLKESIRIDLGIPYDIAKAAYRLTEGERNRMAKETA